MDDAAWELLMTRLDRIEEKVDKINGVCERVKGISLALKFLYGILGAGAVAILVGWVRTHG